MDIQAAEANVLELQDLPIPGHPPTRKDWEAYRAVITKWYKVNSCTGRWICKTLRAKQFVASEKMLRDRFREWGLNDKNVRRKPATPDNNTLVVRRRRPSVVKHTRCSDKNSVTFDLKHVATIHHGCSARPAVTPSGEEQTLRALRAVAYFLDKCCATCDPQITAADPMWELMRDYWQGFYFMDIGDIIQDTLYQEISKEETWPTFWNAATASRSSYGQRPTPSDQVDICFDCAFAGRHCLHKAHELQEREIHADTVVSSGSALSNVPHPRSPGPVCKEKLSKEQKLAFQTARQTSFEVMPVVTSFLIQESVNIHGPEHPMTLLLRAFHDSEEVDALCDGIVRILCHRFLNASCIDSEATVRLLHSCAWILLEQDQHHQLEQLYEQWKSQSKTGLSWDMMRILALSKMEQGLFEDAQIYMLSAWTSLCERGQPMPDRWLKLLGNRAYLSLLMGRLSECRADLDRASEFLDCNSDTPLWHRSNINQLYVKLKMREEIT
ncbi:uncharacterized protein MYCFIDRAFT_80960 [Pseudocercospora fijiensis CIRAD86]|uniref:Clr5 domain-containing protein n=1 Tax=Pseudocercospora fijiensis (strain CIRAD86) TaxID=383855 RepID=M2ZHE7_PSEFD|nr:uncharacterized protein MYCFIDRAFT_80960 [Pseudocercospora fijiensis CIRAD86]EME78559.1 hypothetical protein MYCFIDRAFT_80960 [Pseudocercospora fijiensis CIRAD86]